MKTLEEIGIKFQELEVKYHDPYGEQFDETFIAEILIDDLLDEDEIPIKQMLLLMFKLGQKIKPWRDE